MTDQELRAEERRYPYRASSVSTMRHEAAEILSDWGLEALADDAQTCVSELGTNAVQHRPRRHAGQASEMELALTITGSASLRLAVRDSWPGIPQPRLSADGDVNGRGLLLVAALSARWGVEPAAPGQRGKTVWCELALPAGWATPRSWHTGPHVGVAQTGDPVFPFRLDFTRPDEDADQPLATTDGPLREAHLTTAQAMTLVSRLAPMLGLDLAPARNGRGA